jgi:hypothetical protein
LKEDADRSIASGTLSGKLNGSRSSELLELSSFASILLKAAKLLAKASLMPKTQF